MKLRIWKGTLIIPFKVGIIPQSSNSMTKENRKNFQLQLSIQRLDLDTSAYLPIQSCLQRLRSGWLREFI
jgi:hypothetical protein